MTSRSFDRAFWDDLWARTLRENPEKVARRPPNSHLMSELEELRPGDALDAGCGHGADSLWLATRGWQVTGVDFSAAALSHARAMADAAGDAIARRMSFLQCDLAHWAPETARYDLVVSLYVHVAGSVESMVRRLAAGVAPGGTLFLVGHQPTDPATGAATAAAGQVQVSVEAVRGALSSHAWSLLVAEHRPRTSGGGVDAVIRAQRAT